MPLNKFLNILELLTYNHWIYRKRFKRGERAIKYTDFAKAHKFDTFNLFVMTQC